MNGESPPNSQKFDLPGGRSPPPNFQSPLSKYLQNVVLSIKKGQNHSLFGSHQPTKNPQEKFGKFCYIYVCFIYLKYFGLIDKIYKFLPLQSMFPWISQ